MTVPINSQQLIGDFLPKVFVTRILLTEAGGSIETRGKNPHYDIPSKPSIETKDAIIEFYNKFGNLKEDEKTTLSTYGPLSKKGNKPLSARIDLNFKDSLENNILGTWFTNEDLKKMVRVQVVASLSSKSSTNLQQVIKQIKSSASSASSTTLNQSIVSDKNLISQFFSLTTGGGPNAGNIISQSNYDTPSGETFYDIRSSLQFKFDKPNINHLTFFVIPYVDIEALENFFDPPITLNSFSEALFGDCRIEPVLRKGEVITTANYFLDSQEQIYVGDVEYINQEGDPSGKLFPYAKATGQKLKKQTTTNTVIQDFRQQDIVKKIDINFSEVKKDLNSKGFTKKQFFDDKLSNSSNFYTPIMSTRSPAGDVKMIFGVNLEWFIKSNSPYGKLWDNLSNSQKSNVFNSKIFKSASLIRKRVKSLENTNLLDEDIPPEVLTTVSLNSPTDTQKSNLGKRNILTRIDIDSFQINTKDKKKFIYFSARDADAKNRPPGYYQYGLRYVFNDAILNTVQEMTLSLNQDFKLFRQLVYISQQPEYYNVYTDSFTKSFGSFAMGEWTAIVPIMLSNFLLLRAVLTGEQIIKGTINDETKQLYLNLLTITHPKVGNPQGMQLLLNLVDELLSFVNELFEVKPVANTAQGFRTPSLSSPKKETKNIIREVYFSPEMGGVIDTTADSQLGYDFMWKPDTTPALQNTGVQGKIDLDRVSPQGLSSFSYEYFTDRVKQETEKYFTSDQLQLNLRLPKIENKKIQSDLDSQKYKFLSPSLVQSPQLGFIPLLSKGSNKIDYNRLNTLYTEIIKRRLNNLDSGFKVDKKEFKFLSQNDKEQKYQLEQIMSLKGGTVVTTDRAGAELFGLINPPTEEGQNISFNNLGSPLGPSQTEIQEQSSFETLGSGVPPVDETTGKLLQETNYNDALLGLTIVDAHGGMHGLKKFTNRINGGGRNKNEIPYVTLEDLVPLPNQLKQLVILNSDSNLSDVQNTLDVQADGTLPAGIDGGSTRLDLPQLQKLEKQFGIWINYFNLVKVQVFSGFQFSKTSGTDYVLQNAFVDLTPEHFTIIKNSNMRVICRLAPYINEDLNITEDNTLSLPIFDQYFIIESGPNPALKASAKQNLADMTNLLNGMSSHTTALETPPDYVNTGGFYDQGIAGKKGNSLTTGDGFTGTPTQPGSSPVSSGGSPGSGY